MEGNLPFSEIISILNSKGFNLTNERSLLDPGNNYTIIWSILSSLFKNIEPIYIRNILATQCHDIGEDHQKHKNSLPFISDFLVINDIFKMMKIELRLMPFMKSTKEAHNLQTILSKAIALCRWQTKIKKEKDYQFTDFSKAEIIERETKMKLEEISFQYEKLKQKKKDQEPIFNEKIESLQNSKENVHEKRNTKNKISNEILENKQLMTKKDKYLEQLRELDVKIQNQINQKKSELIQNAPQIKKQKRYAEEQLHELLNNKNNQLLNLREKIQISQKFLVEDRVNQLEQTDSYLEIAAYIQNYQEKQKQFQQTSSENQQYYVKLIHEIAENQQIHKSQEDQIRKTTQRIVNLQKVKHQTNKNHQNMIKVLNKKKKSCNNTTQTKNQLEDLISKNQKNIEKLMNEHDEKVKKIKMEIQFWSQRTENKVRALHQVFSRR